MNVRKIRRSSPLTERARAKKKAQLECRLKADLAKILPRDRTAYIVGCLEADNKEPTPTVDQVRRRCNAERPKNKGPPAARRPFALLDVT